MLCTSYQEALDEIYRTYMAVKGDVKGKYDRQVRDPVRLVSIASRLGVVPAPEKIIRVTGSKGKGTTSRLIASQLQKTTGRSVGLLVSPEELEHTDRMRVNGCQITKDEFVSLLNELDEVLSVAKQALSPGQYLSPSGLFLLLALVWFRRREVQLFVLETGRGVLFDEVGQIPSAVSVITSILLEHPEYLGPTLSDIARDKLSIARSSSHVIVPHSVAKLSEDFAAAKKNIQIVPPPGARSAVPRTALPDWLVQDGRLAETAVSTFLGCSVNELARIAISEASAAFGSGSLGSAAYAFEAIVNLDSLDRELFSAWRSGFHKLLVVTSLPDDKDRERLLDYFQRQDCQIVEVVLDGIRGYLDYDRARKSSHASIICDYRNTVEFKEKFADYVQSERPDFIYFAGTHTFIRLVKLTLGELDRNRLASE
jgi:hypothetical protein